ncbi:unnamed protein product [Phaedon cochleariae]|uniref:TMC domain-containing protein n=1 Tax=Phaedon cochleariae TaxID=80249 RepID=A0A9P0GWH4_PHACE|nr:unnamed protein product [Phaedon cochleariae]
MTLWEFDGVLKYSPLFYGWYTNSDNSKGGYRLPFAYFVTGLVVYGYSFFATLRKMAENSRMSKLSEKDDECIFSWKLFTAWDYMIGNAETAHNRVASIVMGFKEALLEEAEKKKVTRNWEVIGFRVLVNTVVLGLLGSSVWAIIMVVKRSTEPEAQDNFWRKNETSFVISLISFIFPMIFEVLGLLEQYHPRKQLRLQLARIMVLNLLNLYSLIFALFDKIDDMTAEQEQFRNITKLMNESSTTLRTTPLYTTSSMDATTSIPFIETTECYEECLVTEIGRELIADNLISELSLNVSNVAISHLEQLIMGFVTNISSALDTANSTFPVNSSLIFNISDSTNETLLNIIQTLIPESSSTNMKDMFIDYLTYILYSLNDSNSTMTYFDNDTIIPEENVTDIHFSTTSSFEQFTTVFPFLDNLTGTNQEDIFLTSTLSNILDNVSATLSTVKESPTNSPNCRNICTVVKIPLDTEISSPTITTTSLEITEMGLNYSMQARLRSLCWETMFGQELIRLTLTDLVMTIVPTLGMDFFRGIFVRYMNRCWCWDLEKRFPQYGDFKVAENILSLVNNQGMVWMGMFFSPGIVLLNVIKLYIFMYFRGWAVMTCNVPHEVIFRASRSNNFYYALLLMMLFLCVLPVGYTIVWITPSWHCGPFSKYQRIFHIFTKTIRKSAPKALQRVLDYIASPGIVIPLLVLLILIIYYLVSLTGALREANDDLKIQLRRERTEERRKMFQLVDRRRRGGSGESNELSNTPFNKWKKLLGNLPGGKSMDDTTPKQEENDIPEAPSEEEHNENKSTDFFSKLIKRALRKSSTSDDEQNAGDGTDTEQHDSLPYDSTTSRQQGTVKPFSWRTADFQSIANRALQLTKVKPDNNSNDREYPSSLKQDVETRPISRQNSDLRRDIHRRDSHLSKINQPTTSKGIRQDSESSVWSDGIPVITISKTGSAENILKKDEVFKNHEVMQQEKFKPQVKCALKKQSAEVDEETIRFFDNDLERTKAENRVFKTVAETWDGSNLDVSDTSHNDNADSNRDDLLTEVSSSEDTEQKGSSADTILHAPFPSEDNN